jgi:hypothetical protein
MARSLWPAPSSPQMASGDVGNGRPIARPLFVPVILARAMPDTTRSRIMLRSNSANSPSI